MAARTALHLAASFPSADPLARTAPNDLSGTAIKDGGKESAFCMQRVSPYKTRPAAPNLPGSSNSVAKSGPHSEQSELRAFVRRRILHHRVDVYIFPRVLVRNLPGIRHRTRHAGVGGGGGASGGEVDRREEGIDGGPELPEVGGVPCLALHTGTP